MYPGRLPALRLCGEADGKGSCFDAMSGIGVLAPDLRVSMMAPPRPYGKSFCAISDPPDQTQRNPEFLQGQTAAPPGTGGTGAAGPVGT